MLLKQDKVLRGVDHKVFLSAAAVVPPWWLDVHMGIFYNGPNNYTWADGFPLDPHCKNAEMPCGRPISDMCVFFLREKSPGIRWKGDLCTKRAIFACQSYRPCMKYDIQFI
jgi:hypothetical protein